MSPIDMPKPVEQHEKMNAKSESQRLAQEAFYKQLLSTPVKGVSIDMTKIVDVGQISQMDLPHTWKLGTTDNTGGTDFREYHPRNDPEVKLCTYYRGHRVDQPSADAFREVLKKPPHILSPSEIKSLAEIMRNKDDAKVFSMVVARTEDLNGKRVLAVEGRFIEKQYDTHALYVDSDGNGSAVQEIYFQAPKADYMLYIKQARDAFKSIKWK